MAGLTQLPQPPLQPRRRFLRPSISWRLPLWIFLALAVILFASVGFAGIRSRNELQKVLQTNLQALAELQAADVEQQLRQHIGRLEALASSADVRDQITTANNSFPNLSDAEVQELLEQNDIEWQAGLAAGDNRTASQNLLINSVQANPLSRDQLQPEQQNLLRVASIESDFLITDRFGRLIAVSDRENLPSSYAYNLQEWWLAVQGSSRQFVRGPLSDGNGRTIEFAVPIRDGLSGDTIGVLYSSYDFTAIADVIEQTGTVARTLLLASLAEQPETSQTIYAPTNLAGLSDLALPATQATNVLYHFTDPAETGYVLTTAPLQSSLEVIDQMGWSVAALQEESVAFAPISQAQTAAILVAFVTGLTVVGLLFLFYVRPLTNSVERLRASAESLQRGSFDTELAIRRDDELGVLAVTFNDMARRFRQQIETQEQIINDRTASLHRQAERMRLSAEVGRAASASLDADRLMNDTVDLISSQFGFYHATILLLDPERANLVVRAATGELGRRIVADRHSLPVNEASIVGWVASNKKARVALDVGIDPVFFDDPYLPETRSEVALPLFSRGQLLGVLDVQSRQPNDFQQEDIAILQIMADQIASNILNAQLFSETERRANLLSQLQDITTLMNQQTTLQNGLSILAERARQLLDSDGGGVFLWNEAEQMLEMVISADSSMLGRRLAPGEGLAGRAFSKGQTLTIDDYASWAGAATAFADVTSHAGLAVPLKQQDKAVGVLVITRSQAAHPFSLEEIQLIELLAVQAGSIVVNSQLVEETRRLARRERILNRITAEIRRSLDVQTVLETATRELGQTLNDKRIRVRLFAPEVTPETGNGSAAPVAES